MQFATLITAVVSIAVGTNAAAIRRDGARLAQFRVFGAEGCHDLNYGFYTVDQSDVGACNALTTDPTAVTSVNLEVLYSPAANGCSLYIYSDANCSDGKQVTAVNACANPEQDGETYGSWQISCSSSA
ncbi:hypothetical protein E0Z10_g5104 [Xylaria hypoxylon]|uniref:Uncharacterized protein n=1 Tax=Xylaria hypoxylon TaxID=37992 RepID=A0A4Z0YH80_9PEZI|nr:hypothetical protein E0Z10_g5104 [Xylaria hypoxylon]